ncbi:MAG: tellurite resistance/C4-dicarboxylate transporter family protein [Pyrinomonadaceae bacterium]
MKESDKEQSAISQAIAGLFPGYFALIMATGITSIAADLLEMELIAWGLVYLNTAAFAVLWSLLLIRVVRFPARMRADINDHARGPGFFTVAAGTCVFGSQLVLVAGQIQVAAVLWFVGLVLWIMTMYGFLLAITVRENKPALEQGLNGAWLLAGVATQSISVLGTLLAAHYRTYSNEILFFTLIMFLVGCMLYLILITLIFYQFTFLNITSETLTPPYWINMGAVAITTLAGARLIIAAGEWPLLGELVPFLKGFTLFFWATGTWWIPLLFILGFWRHVYKRFPIRYDPQYWGMVFPLGMYTACTFQLSKALGFEPLMVIPRVFIYLAMAAWLAAFAGLLYSLVPRRS